MREISQADYEIQTKKPETGSLIPLDVNKAIIDEIVKRLSRRPIRFDVVYDGTGNRIKSVIPIYGETHGR